MSTTEQTGNSGAEATPAPRPGARKRALVPWTIATALLGLVIWAVYVVAAIAGPTCPTPPGAFFPIFYQGGAASGASLVAAAALAGCLWLAASVAAWRLRRRLARLFVGFVGCYVVALVALAVISPSIWGVRHCGGAAVDNAVFSQDGRTVASGDNQGVVRLWDVSTQTQYDRPLDTTGATTVAFSPDGRILAALDGTTVRLWGVRTHQERPALLTANTDVLSSLAFSPDSRRLASGSRDGSILLWDLPTRKQAGQTLERPTGNSVSELAFSPDGRTLASGSDDWTVQLWDVRTHRQLGQPLSGHTSTVFSVAFSPDGHTIASGSYDRTIRLWDAHTHRQLGKPLRGHTDAVNSVAFSPDGRILASGGGDKRMSGSSWNFGRRSPV